MKKNRESALLLDGRLSERVPANELGAENVMILEIRDLTMETVEARMLDVSKTGMGLHTDRQLVLGKMVIITPEIDLVIPKKGVVMWSQQENNGFRAGLKFVRSD